MSDHNYAKKIDIGCEIEKLSASVSAYVQQTVIVAAADNSDQEENEELQSSSRTSGSSETTSKLTSTSDETEDDDGKNSTESRNMSKGSNEIESDDDVIALEAIPITQSRFKQLMQQDIPVKMQSDFQRKRKANRKSLFGGSAKKSKPSVKQEPKEGCCVYCFTDEDSDWKCGKLLKQHDIVIHQHCMYFASDLGQNQEFVDVEDGCISTQNDADEVSQRITKQSLPIKNSVDPIASESISTAWIMGFPVNEIQRDLHRISSLHRCTYCGLGGAGIGCARGQCHVEFHMPCGLENGAFFEHFGKFRSFCSRHAPEQPWTTPAMGIKLPFFARFSGVKLMKPGQVTCVICTASVLFSRAVRGQVVRTSCCKKKNGREDLYRYYHWKCIQVQGSQYALNHGEGHLSCLMCKNEKEFRQQLLDAGLFVPNRDASWESSTQCHFASPNVTYDFDSMYVRSFDCSAVDCLCPDGRAHSGQTGNWVSKYCEDCGSTAFHLGCVASWKCAICDLQATPGAGVSNVLPTVAQPSPPATVANYSHNHTTNKDESPLGPPSDVD